MDQSILYKSYYYGETIIRRICMRRSMTIDEWTFALAIYEKFNAKDRYALFLELLEKKEINLSNENHHFDAMIENKKIKKLSSKKKASFACFLKDLDIEKEMKRYRSKKIQWKYIYSKDYPELLSQIYIPPILLFYQGDYSILKKPLFLAVVGARLTTDYGLRLVEELIPSIIEQSKGEIVVVSGLAKGIDRKAHEECLKSKGRTIGVIGSGLDSYYPRGNKKLQKRMAREELVLSEYPLGSKPLRYHFPERNRIIAGLSRGVLVIEAKERSGSLITAYNALDENRDIFACPGSLLEKTSEGCHKLLQNGAYLIRNSEDILKEWFLI